MPTMPAHRVSLHATRSRRLALMAEVLSDGPQPSEVLLAALNRRLRHEGMPTIAARMLQFDLRWLACQIGGAQITRISRAALRDPPPASWRKHRWFYRLDGTENVFPVTNAPNFITDIELIALKVARGLLAIHRKAPPLHGRRSVAGGDDDAGLLADALGRLVDRMGLTEASKNHEDVAGVTQFAPQTYDPIVLVEIFRAIRLGQSIAMHYRAIALEPQPMRVQPISVVFWAWDPSVQPSLRQYKVARASDISRRDGLSGVPTGLALEVRLRRMNAFRGYTGEGKPQRVSIRFSPIAAKQIEGRSYGSSQGSAVLPDGGVRLTFRTAGVEAVQRWVLRFGKEAVLEEPASAVAWVRDNLQAALKAYTKPS